MRYLVTGGCGFIGSRLVESLLADGHAVVVLDDLSAGSASALPPSVPLLHHPIEVAGSAVSEAGPIDGIFHLAAVSSVEVAEADPVRAQRVNVEGTAAMLGAAAAARPGPLPIVLASSAAVYGSIRQLAISEDRLTQPTGIYGVTKRAAEELAQRAFRDQGVPSAAIRLFNVYGPWPRSSRPPTSVIATFCRRLSAGEGLSVHGDGRQQRDFVHVDDAVHLLKLAMASVSGRANHLIVNGCTGVGTSLLDLVGRLAALAPRPLTWSHSPPRPSDVTHSVGDPSLAVKALRYRPAVSLEEGLRRLVEFTATAPDSAAAQP